MKGHGPLYRAFFHYGGVIGRHPWAFLITPLLFPLFLWPIILYNVSVNTTTAELFMPRGSGSIYERKLQFERYHEWNHWEDILTRWRDNSSEKGQCQFAREWEYGGGKVERFRHVMHTFIVSKSKRNLLLPQFLDRVHELDTYSKDNLTVEHGGERLNFWNFCSARLGCPQHQNLWLRSHRQILHPTQKDLIQVDYPLVRVLGMGLPIGDALYGVEVGEAGAITSAYILLLIGDLAYDQADPVLATGEGLIETKLREFWKEEMADDEDIYTVTVARDRMNRELEDIRTVSDPYVLLLILVQIGIVILTNFSASARNNKSFLGLMGMLSVGFACICAYSIVIAFGTEFNPMLSLVPFLVGAIGIDDAFILIRAWKLTDHRLPPEQRMALTMAEAGVSITLTTATDIACLVLGYLFCVAEALNVFCIFAGASLLADYVYQITFFPSLMTFSGRRERDGPTCAFLLYPKAPQVFPNTTYQMKPKASKVAWHRRFLRANDSVKRWLEQTAAAAFRNKSFRLVLGLCFLVYVLCAISLTTRIQTSMSLRNMVLDTSPFQPYFALIEDEPVDIFVEAPPDFTSRRSYERFLDFVHKLEGLPGHFQSKSTLLWVPDYLEHLAFFGSGLQVGSEEIRGFYEAGWLLEHLADSGNWPYVWFNCSATRPAHLLRDFHFVLYYGPTRNWAERRELMDGVRGLCAEYSDFRPTPHALSFVFLDQELILVPSCLQTMGLSFIAVAVISIALITMEFGCDSVKKPTILISAFLITFTLLTIEIGVVGGLVLFGVKLDSLTLICLLITIGFAVDFTAHIAMRMENCSESLSVSEKIGETIRWMGWPLVQAALTTVCAVLCLSPVPCDLMRTFYRSVCLVIGLGLLHGLLVIPLLYTLLPHSRPSRRPR